MMKVLVIGGAGYIGSVMVRCLMETKHQPVVFDNLSTGHRDLVPKNVPFIKGDLKKIEDIRKVFKKHSIGAVMHFAASSLVGESVHHPLKYYENNVGACVNLLKVLSERKIRHLIFSSTAATYGEPKRIPIREEDPTFPTNPYGQSKLMIEQILKDFSRVNPFSYIALRYFNACGAHACGAIGERHHPETHLIPNILKAASGKNKKLEIYGDDYDTPDGTCVRDYIHVEDLASAHLLALEFILKGGASGVYNLGNGNGFSIKEIVKAAENVIGKKIKYTVKSRRPGDPARLVADARRARKWLKWQPKRGLEDIIRSAWHWELKDSNG